MPKLIIEIEPETHKKLKMLALDDDRSLNKYITRGLEYLANMPIPYHKLAPGVTPTPVPTQQPFVYTPTTTTPIPYTPENPTNAPVFTNSIIDTSQMTGLEQQEYARKQAAEAKTKIALEKQEARSQARTLTPEEEQINQQKLELQKQKIQEKRDSLIRDRAIELDVEDAESYNEDWLLNRYFGMAEMMHADYYEEEKGIPNPYKNPPKSMEELYSFLDKIKQSEQEEKAEEDRRDALPHDKDDYDYKSEDFIRDVKESQETWIERHYGVPGGYDDEDYKILYNYFYNNHLYHDFVYRMNNPYTGFDIDDDATLLSSIFNRDIKDIDVQYISALMCGNGKFYRDENNIISYYEQYQAQRAEWQRIIDESKKRDII